MGPPGFRLVNWILRNRGVAKYNFTESGLPEPPLREMGVDTSFETFSRLEDDHEARLAGTVASLYDVRPDNVVITSGASEAIFLVYLVLGRGKAVVPLPNYEPMFTIPRWLGMKVTSKPGDAAVPGAVYGLTDPNNPTGARLPGVDSLAKLAGKSTVFVNETYRGFTFEKPATLTSQHERIVTCNTMTKFYGLGRLRVGWIIADRERAERLQRGRRLISGHSSEYSLWLANEVLQRRAGFVRRARKIHSENLSVVRRFAGATSRVRVTLPEAAPFCLCRYPSGPSSVVLAERLLQDTGVLVSPGDYFGAPKSFRLCFTGSKDELEEGTQALADRLGR